MTRLVHEILVEGSRRLGSALAVSHEGRELTYRALDQTSDRIASALLLDGVCRGDRVGIYLDKSPEAVTAIFAILKAGAICVPLDPMGPVERLGYIIDDCGMSHLIAAMSKRKRLEELLPTLRRAPRLLLVGAGEEEATVAGAPALSWERALATDADAPASAAIDLDLAYILYTSGSTGRPKGVMLSHRNVLSFVDWAGEHFSIGEADRVASHAPLHFDLSILDVFVTLRGGGSVFLVPQGIAFMPVDLARFIAGNRITVWQSVPTVLMMLSKHLATARPDLQHLRLVLFAGEPFPPRALRALMRMAPHPRYYNIYGATEINDVTCHHVAEPPAGEDAIPIGRACSNVELFALDEEGRLISEPGVAGELYARGGNVSPGYWGDAAMTAERFVQNPLHDLYRDTVYRTGDLVERDAAGDYRYLGRRDAQVKIRGNRVNLSEVEAVVSRFRDVSEAAVMAVDDAEGGRVLKAFIVPADGAEVDPRGLRRHCLKSLPAYMIPEETECRPALPKTSTGKVDRRALAGAG